MANNDKNNVIPSSLELMGEGPAYKAKLCRMLKKTGMFEDFSPLEIETLAKYMDAYTARKGTAICIEGARAGFMAIIVAGRLEIFKDNGRGKTKKINEVGAGNSIGEMSIVDGLPRSATAVAMELITLVVLTQDNLQRIIEQHPQLGTKVLWRSAQVISQRLRRASAMLADADCLC